ncbi:MAG: hypothetical protein RDU20_20875 [Desulfomonilaceae bacterium]|nr:hypothetical protein [Desulfomonilaceae bacterium]
MNIDKVLDLIRLLGKYLTICTVIAAVLHGILFRQFWAPFYLSIACWIGILIWLAGAGGMWLRQRASVHSSKRKERRKTAR